MKQRITLLLTLALLLSLAACGGTPAPAEPADATTAGIVSTTAAEDSSVPAEESSTEPASETAAETTAEAAEETTEAASETSTVPAAADSTTQAPAASTERVKSQQELLAMYNSSLAASSALQRREYKRSLSAGGLWRSSEPEAVMDLAKEEGMPALIAISNSQAAPHDLSSLDSSMVKSIRLDRQNGKDVLSIQLRDHSAKDLNSKSAAGYTGITTLDENKTLVKDIAKSLYSIGAVSIRSSTTKLSGGLLTATLSSSGSIESLHYTAQQTTEADLKILMAINAGLTITYQLSAQYR